MDEVLNNEKDDDYPLPYDELLYDEDEDYEQNPCSYSFLYDENTPFTSSISQSNEATNIINQVEAQSENITIRNNPGQIDVSSRLELSNHEQHDLLHQQSESKSDSSKISRVLQYTQRRDQELSFCKNKSKKNVERKRADLTEKQNDFSVQYKLIFTRNKKFKKEFIIGIHDEFLKEQFGFEKLSREIRRSINKYFISYEQYSDDILSYLLQNKEKILMKFPELKLYNW